MRDVLKSHYKSIGKFTLVGVSNTAIDFLVFILLYEVFGIYYLVAHVCGFMVALCNSFYFNATWTFKRLDKEQWHKQAATYALVNAMGMVLSTLTIFVANFFVWVYAAKVLASLVSFVWNYCASSFFVFNKKSDESSQTE
ncbi:MAG: GtrA family protein [Alphaproteobacteria bacterium]|nr:GtrA family protein [Alphaproteobacteria bacterium]